jgi:hypothetical protein
MALIASSNGGSQRWSKEPEEDIVLGVQFFSIS